MESIQSTFAALERSVGENGKKAKQYQKELTQLSSVSRLLSLSVIPPSTTIRLSNLFRQTLCRIYPEFLIRALAYAMSILQYIHECKIQTSVDVTGASQWQALQAAIISGILDFMEEQPNAKTQVTVADQVYPVICPLYIDKSADRHLWTLNRGLVVTICHLLNAITMGNGVTASQLRQRVGGSRIGKIISKVQDFLVLEAALMLFGYLTPPLKKGREPRSAFIKEVFDQKLFPAHDRIASLAELSPPDQWDNTLIQIVAVMAEGNLALPQPFDVKEIKFNNTSMSLEPPMYVDNTGLSGNYERADGALDTLDIQFSALKIIRCNVEKYNAAIHLELLHAIDIGGKKVEIHSGISFTVSVTRLSHFIRAVKQRNVNVQLGQPRFSTAGKEINLDIPLVREDSKASSQKRIQQFTQAHLDPLTSPSLEYVTSPRSALKTDSSAVFDKQCPVVPPHESVSSILTAPTSPVYITSEDEDVGPIKLRPKGISKNRAIVISEDEEVDIPPQKASKNDPDPRDSDSLSTKPPTAKRRATRSTTAAKVKQQAAVTNTIPTMKRKRVVDSDDEDDLANELIFDAKPTSSPAHPKRAQLQTYRKKAKKVAADQTSPDVNFDELPKSKRVTVKKPPAKSKAPSKPEKVPRTTKRDVPSTTRQRNKSDDGEPDEEETRPVSVAEGVAEDGPTLVEPSNLLPTRSAKPSTKPTTKNTSPPPLKKAKPKKAPWEDMDTFCAPSEENLESKIIGLPPRELEIDHDCSDDFDPTNHSMLGNRYVDFTVPVQQFSSSSDMIMADTTAVDSAISSSPKKVMVYSPVSVQQLTRGKTTSAEIEPMSPVLPAAELDIVPGKVEIPAQRPPLNKDKSDRMVSTGRDEHLTERLNINQNANRPSSPVETRHAVDKSVTLSDNVSIHFTRPKHCSGADAVENANADEMYSRKRTSTSVGRSESFEWSSRSHNGLRSPTNSHPGRKNNDHELKRLEAEGDGTERPRFVSMHRSNDLNIKPTTTSYKRREHVEDERSIQMTSHQPHGGRVRAAPQKPVIDHDPMDKIAEVLNEINEAIIDKIRNNFQSVTGNLEISQQAAVLHVVERLVKMQSDRGENFNELLEAAKGTKGQIEAILKSRQLAHLASVHSLKCYKEIIEEHDRRTLSKKFPTKLIPKLPPTIAKYLK